MAEDETTTDQLRSMMAENFKKAHGALANYFQFVEKNISASPLGATDQTKTFRNYVERSVAASFGLSDKLLHAKDFQDVLRIQTEVLSNATTGVDRTIKRIMWNNDQCGVECHSRSD
jgi:hypothetical protein